VGYHSLIGELFDGRYLIEREVPGICQVK